MKPPVLGLDPGLRTGVALIRNGGLLFACDYDCRADWHDDEGQAMHRWHAYILGQLREHKPALLVIEKAGGSKFSGTVTIPNVVRVVAQMAAYQARIPVKLLAVSTIRKRICGTGKAKKHDVARELEKRGLHASNDHARDAVAVALAGEGA